MRELNDAIVSSRKIKFEEFKEEDHKTTSVSSSEEPMENGAKQLVIRFRKVVQAPKRELKKQLKKSIDPNAIENMKKWISWIQRVLMLLYWLSKRRKRERKQNTGNDPFILTNRKSAGEVSWRNITSSRI
ncbi:hypothetical protein CUMW_129770 [Citrus unshiu]|nr:hypothetical protein CUMW_129770 [Citrus unshiu]